jgi:hypothetical protein
MQADRFADLATVTVLPITRSRLAPSSGAWTM